MKTQRWRLNWNGADITSAISSIALGTMLITATTAPAAAQSVVVQRGFSVGVTHSPVPPAYIYQPPAASYIYGSPIPTPVPVNPVTGLAPSTSNYQAYPVRRNIVDSTLVNPVLVNPTIRNSTLINPVIVNDPVYRAPVGYGRSRIIYYPY